MREKQFLLITLSLIVLVGAPSVYSMIQEPMVHGVSTSRGPASDGQAKPVSSIDDSNRRNTIKARSVTLDFNCVSKKNEPVQEVAGNLLRLRGTSCFNEKWKNVSVVNTTNGYTAAVIFLNKGFTTDFMDIADGENKLAISGINEKGEQVQRLLMIKRSPASLF